MSGVPWWLTWVVLALFALLLLSFLVAWMIGLIVKVLFYLVLAALVGGGLWHLYRRARTRLTSNSGRF